jgi:hypothetical protein
MRLSETGPYLVFILLSVLFIIDSFIGSPAISRAGNPMTPSTMWTIRGFAFTALLVGIFKLVKVFREPS